MSTVVATCYNPSFTKGLVFYCSQHEQVWCVVRRHAGNEFTLTKIRRCKDDSCKLMIEDYPGFKPARCEIILEASNGSASIGVEN